MSRKSMEQSVYRIATELIKEKGYVSPVDLLVKMERLKQKQVEDWRFKRITYLERVVSGNLAKLNSILKTLEKFARERNLKSSITVYKSWGKGPKRLLRFSKNGSPYMEELYSTHYVLTKNTKEYVDYDKDYKAKNS